MLIAQQGPNQFSDLPDDITDPIQIGAGNGTVLLLVAMAVALAVCGALLWFYLKRKGQKPAAAGQLPPREEARRRLAHLHGSIASLDPGDLAGELSATVKRFFRRQFRIDLESLTTDEYWASLDEVTKYLPSTTVEPLAQFFAQCDQLRFQGGEISPARVEPLFQQAQALIETNPVMASA